jgi:hypothetical protein
MQEKTIIELVEDIIQYSNEYAETKSDPVLLLIKDRASVLSERLNVNDTSALCFSYILWQASLGHTVTRSDVMRFLPPSTNIIERLQSLWRLLDAQLINSYFPNKIPTPHYFISQEVGVLICANKVPSFKSSTTLFPKINNRLQFIAKKPKSNDFLIMLDGKQIGFVLQKPCGKGFDVYHNGNLLFESESLNDVKERMKEIIEQNDM